jgi:hypothetical protein
MFSLLLLNENQNRSNYNYYIYETICCGILINECYVNQDYEDNNELVIIPLWFLVVAAFLSLTKHFQIWKPPIAQQQ